MTIEATLERIAESLEGIHRLLANGYAPNADAPKPNATTPANADDGKSADAKAKNAATPTPDDEKTSADAGGAPTKDNVRDALKLYQKRHNAAAARKILQDHGAKTLTDLDEDQYQAVIDAATAEE